MQLVLDIMNLTIEHTSFLLCVECQCVLTVSHRKATKQDINNLPMFIPTICNKCIEPNNGNVMTTMPYYNISLIQEDPSYKLLSHRYRSSLPLPMFVNNGIISSKYVEVVSLTTLMKLCAPRSDIGYFNVCKSHLG